MAQDRKTSYEKPQVTKLDNLKLITFDCPNFQCSVVVPPPPA
jgi:hypothetical protein